MMEVGVVLLFGLGEFRGGTVLLGGWGDGK